MRQITPLLLLFLGFLHGLHAVPYPDDPFACPRSVQGNAIFLAPQDFDEDDMDDQSIRFTQIHVDAGHCACLCPGTGMRPYLGYTYNEFVWKNNEFFTQREYPTVEAMISAFTGLIPRWLWRGAFGIRQQTEEFNIGRWGLYQGYLWGRYCVNPRLGVHVGFLFTRGLKNTFVFPILGFDYEWTKFARFYAVFPLDMALILCFSKHVQFSLAGRWLRWRFRAGNNNPLPQGLFEYRTWGVEGRLTICFCDGIGFDLFAGTTIYGWVRVENPTGTHLTFNNLKGAPYAGLEYIISF